MIEEEATYPRREPQQARSREMVAAMVEATARVLAREGLEALTTNRIAEVAGVSIGSLYQYFPNKEALLAALIERELEADIARVREIVARRGDRGLEELVRVLVDEMIAATRADLHQRLLPLVDQVHRDRLVAQQRQGLSELMLELLEERWEELAARLRRGEDAAERVRGAALVALRAMELAFNAVKVEAPELLERPEALAEDLVRIFRAVLLDP